MKPRITLSIDPNGELQIWLNESGRDLFVRELQALSTTSDHFHLGPENLDSEVPVQTIAYNEGDRVLDWGKVMIRTDDWDARYYPHVLGKSESAD